MDLNTIGGSEEDSCKLILYAHFDLLRMYIFHVLRVERFRTLNGTIKKVLALFELLAIALAQQKSMCHLNLANLMDVQKRHIPNHTCGDSWARRFDGQPRPFGQGRHADSFSVARVRPRTSKGS
ncbi:hypothetical protein J6590_099418 [Homalodisca vitripennis]|nr:hypothetical protein J6590_099418 [Homalodisca vitripennis]